MDRRAGYQSVKRKPGQDVRPLMLKMKERYLPEVIPPTHSLYHASPCWNMTLHVRFDYLFYFYYEKPPCAEKIRNRLWWSRSAEALCEPSKR